MREQRSVANRRRRLGRDLQRSDCAEIHDQIHQHQAKIEHRHQRLAAREGLGGAAAIGQGAHGVLDRTRAVVGKRRRLHAAPTNVTAGMVRRR
jgi:hypothetical protein